MVHELTHALVHGVRPRLAIPTSTEVLAFHEGFAELVSAFHQFSDVNMVREAVRRRRLEVVEPDVLAHYVYVVTGPSDDPRRSGRTPAAAADDSPADGAPPALYFTPGMRPAEGSALLVSAVFEAYARALALVSRRDVMLATNDTGVLPAGGVPPTLDDALAEAAAKLAGRFLAMCVRALDYCPPVDVELGDFLRAVLTADRELVPDDRFGFRELWIAAFRRCGIYPRNVVHMSEDALLWRQPERAIPEFRELAFGHMRFDGDPRYPASPEETLRQKHVVGRVVSVPAYRAVFGIVGPGDERLRGDAVTPPTVERVRTTVRVGPAGRLEHLTVAEVVQRRIVKRPGERRAEDEIHGGASIVLGPRGDVRYIISKGVGSAERMERELAYRRGIASAFPAPRGQPSASTEGQRAPAAARRAGPPPEPLAQATLAILLVSPAFVGSTFIEARELPALLRSAEQDALRLLCIAVSSVLAERLPVAKFQWLNTPERPLDLFTVPEQNREYVAIARQIAELLDERSPRHAGGRSGAARA